MSVTSAAAMQGEEELRRLRNELGQAESAIVARVSDTPVASGQVINDVATTEHLDPIIVQRALWHLIHEGTVEFTNGYDVRKT